MQVAYGGISIENQYFLVSVISVMYAFPNAAQYVVIIEEKQGFTFDF